MIVCICIIFLSSKLSPTRLCIYATSLYKIGYLDEHGWISGRKNAVIMYKSHFKKRLNYK